MCLCEGKKRVSHRKEGKGRKINSPIVKFIFKSDNFTKETQGAQYQKCVCTFHEYQYATQQILIENTIFYVVRVMFHAK